MVTRSLGHPVLVTIAAVIVTVGFISLAGALGKGGEGDSYAAELVDEVHEERLADRVSLVEQSLVEDPVREQPPRFEAAPDKIAKGPSLQEMQDEEDCVPHPPIRIVDDAQFRAPGSGVVNPWAEGTAGDPFVIEGWCVLGTPGIPPLGAPGISPTFLYQLNSLVDQLTEDGMPDALITLEGTTSHVVIRDNVLTGGGYNADSTHTDGLLLENTENVKVENNTITDNDWGVSLWSSDKNVVEANTITRSRSADVSLVWSSGTEISGNEMTQGLRVAASEVEHVHHEVDISNTVNGDELVYVLEAGEEVANQAVGQLIVADSTGVTVDRVTVTGAVVGVQVLFSGDITVEDSRLSENQAEGIQVSSSDGVVIEGNTVIDNGRFGVFLGWGSDGTVVEANTITDNGWDGMFLFSDENVVSENSISHNDRDGVQLRGDENVVRGNAIIDNGNAPWYAGNGVWLGGSAKDNQLTSNVIADNNGHGVHLTELSGDVPSGTIIEHNNIQYNTGHGLNVDDHEDTVQAIHNWWGASNGPSGGVVDDCTGTLADGDGDGIRVDDAEVCFDPWLTEANPDAGAS